MRRLQKIKPSGRGIAQVLPERVNGGAVFYDVGGNSLLVYEEFASSALDTDDWEDASTLGTGGSVALTVSSSWLFMDTSTGTAGTAIQRLRSNHSAGAHLYNIPFRVTYWAAIATTAGAGVAPSNLTTGVSCLYAYLGVKDTAETQIARFNFDLTTAGSTSLASPVVNVETRAGSTAAAFINSAAHTLFSTAANVGRTVTAMVGYTIDITHRGITFGYKEGRNTHSEPTIINHFGNAPLALDKNYFLDMSLTADGTAGFTQTDGVQMYIDSVIVEQYAPEMRPMDHGAGSIANDNVHGVLLTQPLASNAAALVTTGSGVFYGLNPSSSATGGLEAWIAVWDASGSGSAVYDFSASHSTFSRLIYYAQVGNTNSAAAEVHGMAACNPPAPLRYTRGLVVGFTTVAGAAAGSTAGYAYVMYENGKIA